MENRKRYWNWGPGDLEETDNVLAKWDEGEHPRGHGGKFTAGPGGGAAEATAPEDDYQQPKTHGGVDVEEPKPQAQPELDEQPGVGGVGPGELDEPTKGQQPQKPKGKKKWGEQGGSYRRLLAISGPNEEVHHMPAQEAMTSIHFMDAPCIRMDKADHRLTASCGTLLENKNYRAKQHELIMQGKWREAQKMDIDDLREKFGKKYDAQIAELEAYSDTIKTDRYGLPKDWTKKEVRAGKG